MYIISRSLTALVAALVLLWPTAGHAATYAVSCQSCHVGTVSTLPNGTSTSGSIRAANNLAYLNTKIGNGMGGSTTSVLTQAERLQIANEIGASASVAAPVVTSSAPPGGTRGTAYSFTVTTTAKPSLAVGSTGAGDPLPNAFTITSGALPTGLSINGSSGAITGTPSAAGTFTGNIGASNLVGTPASQAFSMVIAKTTTSTALGSSINPTVFGQSTTFTATVSAGFGTPTGTVTFKDGVTTIGGPVTLAGGVATFATAALATGGHSITAVYNGDANNFTSTSSIVSQTVNKDSTSTALGSSANPSVFGQNVTFTATVSPVAPGAGTPTGTVTFKDGAATIGSPATLSGGVATLSTSALAVGGHSITAVYNGDTNNLTSTSSILTQTVNKDATTTALVSSANPSVFGQNVTFTATVSSVAPGAGTPTGTVTFKDGAATIGSPATLSGGVAALTTGALAVGGHSITAVYNGDANNLTSTSSTLSQTVGKDSTSTTLGTSVNPSVFGQNVTFTATVSPVAPGAGTPTGTVTFKDGLATIGSPATLSGGVATLSSNALAIGSHSITAVYNGDANNNASAASNTVTQTVNQAATSTTLVSSVNPSGFGQNVTFTATVSPVAPGAGTPTGTVTFKDGAVTLGTGPLSGGVATFTTNTLSLGSHSITAQYAGDASYAAVTSATLPFTVNIQLFALTVSKSGPGPGSVVSSPAGIDCGSTCTASFANGTSVTLTATPAAGSTFTSWTGCDSTTGPQCTVSIAAARTVTASFGLDPLADSDGDGIPNGVEITEGRDPLVKDNDVFGNARLFAMQQYRDFLGREGDAGGINYWASFIGGGGARAAVTESFFGSSEFQGTGAPVVRLYFAYFLRIPDYGGLTFWMNYYRAGNALANISNAFAGSQEFVDRYGALSNDAFVDLVYQNVLGRAPDTGGRAFWLGQLNGGMTRGEMMIGFSESAEYQSAIFNETYVTMMYVGMLKRAPDSGGFAFWVGYLDGGNSGQTLISGFLGSAEYHNRFLP